MFMTKQQIRVYTHVQSRIIVLQQHVSVTPMVTIRVPYNKNTISVVTPSGFIRQFCTG